MKHFLLLTLLLFNLRIQAQQTKVQFRESFFYEITKPGLSPSYMYGTMHVRNYKALQIPDTLFKLCANLDAYVFEILLDSVTINSAKQLMSINRQKQGFKKVATNIQYQKAKKFFQEKFNEDFALYDTLTPFELSSYLGPKVAYAAYTPDQVLYGFSLKQNKQLIALETPAVINEIDFSYDAYNFELHCDLYKSSNTFYGELLDNYYEGNYPKIYQLINSSKSMYPKLHSTLYTKRNLSFNTQVLKLLLDGKRILVGVGVGHFVGNDGMIKFLEGKGFKVTRISGVSSFGQMEHYKEEMIKMFNKESVKETINSAAATEDYDRLLEANKYDSLLIVTNAKIKSAPKDEFALLYKSLAYNGKEDFENAIIAINELLKISDRTEYKQLRGVYNFGLGRYAVALTDLKLVLLEEKDNKEVLWLCALSQYYLNMFAEAQSNFQKYHQLYKEEEALLWTAFCKIQTKNYQEGIQILNGISEQKNKNVEYYDFLAIAYLSLEDTQNALKNYLLANELSKGQYAEEVANRYYELEKYEQAIPYYNQYIALGEAGVNTYYYKAHCYYLLKNFASAKEGLLKALELDANHSDANYYMALIYQEESKLEQALFHINKAATAFPDFFNFYVKGELLYQLSRNKEAIIAFENAIKYDGKNANSYNYLGMIYEQMGLNANSCQYYKKAKALGATDVDEGISKVCK